MLLHEVPWSAGASSHRFVPMPPATAGELRDAIPIEAFAHRSGKPNQAGRPIMRAPI